MLTWALICLIGSVITGLFAYRKKQNTAVTYITKMLFFIFLFSFLFLLVAAALHTAPPVDREPAPVSSLRPAAHLA